MPMILRSDHGLRYGVNCSILFTDLPLPTARRGQRGRVRRRRVLVAVRKSVPADRDVEAFVAAGPTPG